MNILQSFEVFLNIHEHVFQNNDFWKTRELSKICKFLINVFEIYDF